MREKDEKKWNQMYELAKAYYEYHGNLDIPAKLELVGYEHDKITKLGSWISRQRVSKGGLSKEKIEKLDNIGMIWDANYKKRRPDTGAWEKMYELAKAYYEYHGNLDIPTKLEIEGYEQDKMIKLGSWLSNQKTRYKLGKLSEERREKLENIGMIWSKRNKRK